MPKITEEDGIRTIDTIKSMNEDAFIDGLWDDGKNNICVDSLEDVKNSLLESNI